MESLKKVSCKSVKKVTRTPVFLYFGRHLFSIELIWYNYSIPTPKEGLHFNTVRAEEGGLSSVTVIKIDRSGFL